MAIFDLREQRLRSLERVRQSIDEMKIVRASLESGSPNLQLVDGLLKSLQSAEARLVGGLIGKWPKVGSR